MSEINRDELLHEIEGFLGTDLLCYRAPSNPLPLGEGGDPRSGEGEGIAHSSQPSPGSQSSPPSPGGRGLYQQQAERFDPVLAWIAANYAAAFVTTESIMPVAQNAAAIAAIKNEFAAANDAQLLALAELTGLLGSALLTLALWKGHLTLEQALTASRLDEQHAAERYGLDPVIEHKWKLQAERCEKCIFFLTGKSQ